MKKIITKNSAVESVIRMGTTVASDPAFWRWGDDNMFPAVLALMSRRSTTHRRIVNDKADYITGKGFSVPAQASRAAAFVDNANGAGESLRQVLSKVAFDKCLMGNAFIEVVTDPLHTFLSLFHQDATRCRVAKDRRGIVLHHDWRNWRAAEATVLPLYPNFAEQPDGTLRSIIHYRDYEPMFENYGVPTYIAGMNVSAIAYKTDRWNISRLDNSFQLSGVMVLDGTVESDAEAEELKRMANDRFAGKPGQVLFVIKDCNEHDNTKFIPISSGNDGDWRQLHDQATTDIVVAHSWFRSLSGLEYGGGWSAERILHEYEVALNTVILSEQEELMEPLRAVMSLFLGEDCAEVSIVNRPPARSKPLYMRIWEARKAEGLDYDPTDPEQRLFVSQITKYALKNID